MRSKEHLVSVGDTRLAVFEQGAGPPVIVVHGWPGDDHNMFGTYLEPLAANHRLLFVDLRGHGDSDVVPTETWTLEQMARDVTNLARAFGLDEFALLGHSFGSFVVLRHALDESTASWLILSCSAPSERFLWAGYDDFGPEVLKRQLTQAAREEPRVQDAEHFARLYRAQLPFFFAEPHDRRIEEYWRGRRKETFSVRAARYFAGDAQLNLEFEQRLGEISQPTLVIAGRHDRATPVEGTEILASQIPIAELVVLESSGHFPFVEEPERYAQSIARFLQRMS